ncbi:L protein [Santa barbara virus]|uniref:Replicase n=1 Tax=Santa barbara virus TaxID=1552661 RepID=A0A097A5B9_9RHAB|nr:L protein [Santa barbara virus]AIS40850.1 L protein [Santa barbara virus]
MDSFFVEDDVSDEIIQLDDDSCFYNVDLEVEEQTGSELLNNNDYNLNSPLIYDDYEFLWEIILLNANPPIHDSKLPEVNLIKDSLRIFFPSFEGLRSDIESPHNFLFSWLITCDLNEFSGIFSKIVLKAANDANQTKSILEDFFGCQFPCNIQVLEKMPRYAWKLGEAFWIFHNIILYMNASTDFERDELKSKYGIKPMISPDKKVKFGTINDPRFGEILVTKNFCTFLMKGVVIPKNTILMFKDILISRFQTILSLSGEIDKPYNENQLMKLITLYNLGDQIILQNGNKGYDLIKMIEPLCNLRLAELAREFRPKIPEFPEYREFINASIKEFEEVGIRCAAQFKELVLSADNLELTLVFYSIFRHWGHPVIEYTEGLNKLYEQVTMTKRIDEDYAQALASDLAFKVLRKKFFEDKIWYVDKEKLSKHHPLRKYILNNTWPNKQTILEFGDRWHLLPLIQCFEIPDFIDPANIYSDKAHSLNKQELLDWLSKNRKGPIKTKRVLTTMLNTPATNWKEFFEEVDQNGLSDEDLLIGLKAKERELKRKGRFFSLMTWRLREYFVATEFLIKKHFVPLFEGLTMADDLITVVKKMIRNSNGQGLNDYSRITIANHIDYEKWNNHQRKESNKYVFKVMGQFLGYPNLIVRTHEFFEKSVIYYAGRADWIGVKRNEFINLTEHRSFWNGQKGGLEGLRQKGWSTLNYLVIERESNLRNTDVKVLAQGDNQTITTNYVLRTYRTDQELQSHIEDICQNNNIILQEIIKGTGKLGLIINKNETVQSADYMNYGKVPIFRGIIQGLNPKRWSRANFVTNDQLPTFSNVLSSISTNSLTVAHYSPRPKTAVYLYNLVGNLGIDVLMYHNPALRCDPVKVIKDQKYLLSSEFKILALYLDPSLGGISGTSLNRFMIRNFPDPLTESLSFWKKIYENTSNDIVKQLAVTIGYPDLNKFETKDIEKLIEDPTGLNLRHGINVTSIIREEIKKNLIKQSKWIKNEIMRFATTYASTETDRTLRWLTSIRPIFPRFLSEMFNATFLGAVKSTVGLFSNSRTIRNLYKKEYRKKIDSLIIKSEEISIVALINIIKSSKKNTKKLWECSSELADQLRKRSWGNEIVGMTVPHPSEILSSPEAQSDCHINAKKRENQSFGSSYVTVLLPHGLPTGKERGPFDPYLGSNTSEGTSLLTPWEKETKIPLLRRAAKMRDCISWFVEPGSNLSNSILNNLNALTNLDWSNMVRGYKRTGSAIHRFSSSRVSSGGFAACSPELLTWMVTTTDSLLGLNDQNYDFMFQSLILWSQMCLVLDNQEKRASIYHFHIDCSKCIREIEDVILEAPFELRFKNVGTIIDKWVPGGINQSIHDQHIENLPTGRWELLTDRDKSFHIGVGIGFLFTDMSLSGNHHSEDSSLFPVSLRERLIPDTFFEGLLIGLLRGSSLQLTHRRNILKGKKISHALLGTCNYAIELLTKNPVFLYFAMGKTLFDEVSRIPHRIPPSYPVSLSDGGSIIRSYLRGRLFEFRTFPSQQRDKEIWIFSDIQYPKLMSAFILSYVSLKVLMKCVAQKEFPTLIKELQALYIESVTENSRPVHKVLKQDDCQPYLCNSEIRHAAKYIENKTSTIVTQTLVFKEEAYGKINSFIATWSQEESKESNLEIPKLQNPLISSMRTFQFATGAHYKLRSIIRGLQIKFKDFICGGDGSGGMTSCLLRLSPFSRGIFNSLLEIESFGLKGIKPPPPSAIQEVNSIRQRCVNCDSCWEEPSDLSSDNTWRNFISLKKEHQLDINLMVFDMEVRSPEMSKKIEVLLLKNIPHLMQKKGIIIYKTYTSRILKKQNVIINQGGEIFDDVILTCTEMSSSMTSEVYLVCFYDPNSPQKKELFFDIKAFELWAQKNVPVFQTLEQEFDRAISLKNVDFEMGVPLELFPDSRSDLTGILVSLGLEGGYAMHLLRELHHYQKRNGPTYIWALTSLLANSILDLSKLSIEAKSFPSDGDCIKLVSWLSGVLNWFSLCTEEIQSHKTIHYLIREGFIIEKLEGAYQLKFNIWTIRDLKQLPCDFKMIQKRKNKRLYLDSELNTIGAITRNLIRLFGFQNETISSKLFDYITTNYNKNINWKSFGCQLNILNWSF